MGFELRLAIAARLTLREASILIVVIMRESIVMRTLVDVNLFLTAFGWLRLSTSNNIGLLEEFYSSGEYVEEINLLS